MHHTAAERARGLSLSSLMQSAAALAEAFAAFDIDVAPGTRIPRAQILAILTRPGGAAAMPRSDAEKLVNMFGSSEFDVQAFAASCRGMSSLERGPPVSDRSYSLPVPVTSQSPLTAAAMLFHARVSEATFKVSGHDAALSKFNLLMDDFASAARRSGGSEEAFRQAFAAGGVEELLLEAGVRFWRAASTAMDTPIAASYYMRLASAAFRGAGLDAGGDATAFAASFEAKMKE